MACVPPRSEPKKALEEDSTSLRNAECCLRPAFAATVAAPNAWTFAAEFFAASPTFLVASAAPPDDLFAAASSLLNAAAPLFAKFSISAAASLPPVTVIWETRSSLLSATSHRLSVKLSHPTRYIAHDGSQVPLLWNANRLLAKILHLAATRHEKRSTTCLAIYPKERLAEVS